MTFPNCHRYSPSIDCIQIRSINWLYSAKRAQGTLMSRRFPDKRGGGALWIILRETSYWSVAAVLSPMWPKWIPRPRHLRGLPLWSTTSARKATHTTPQMQFGHGDESHKWTIQLVPKPWERKRGKIKRCSGKSVRTNNDFTDNCVVSKKKTISRLFYFFHVATGTPFSPSQQHAKECPWQLGGVGKSCTASECDEV